jgi:hypothetical protein
MSWWTMRDRLLVRHFLQRLLDHDMISPHADRREVLTITGALLVVSSLFLAFFLAVKYQFNLFLPPGLTSIVALDDRFFLISIAMIVMGLLAVAEWDALALDTRDTAVLGPLPVPPAVIVRTKFVAIILFAAGFDFALSLGPTVLRSVALPVRLPVTMAGAVRLTVAHAFCATAAGAFGFVAVLGLRETCRAVAGTMKFRRISAGLQASLVVSFMTALLLLPGSYSRVALTWLTRGRMPPMAIPPLWFVGLHEILAGAVIDGLPRGVPPRRYAAAEHDATQLYRSLWPLFHRLATTAVVASVAVMAVTLAACAWNNRRLPAESVTPGERFRLLKRGFLWAATRLVVRRPAAQAGFFFTMQSLARSAPHRVTIAASIAVGFSIAVITLGGNDLRQTFTLATTPLSMLALQTLLVGVVLTAFRHVVRVPADVRASWTFQLAWSGDERPYLAGVKRAAMSVLVVPTLLLLSVGGVLILGPRIAAAHAVTGIGVALLLLELLFLNYRNVPFALGYVRSEDLKAVGPLYVLAMLIGAVTLAGLERAALASVPGEVAFFGALVALLVSVHALDRSRRRTPVLIDFDERPSGTIQRLELMR